MSGAGRCALRSGPLRRIVVAALCVTALCVAPSAAPAEPGARLVRHLRESPQLLGDPGGARSGLERLGIVVQLFAQETLGWKPHGGVVDHATFGHNASYDAFLRADLEELASFSGLDLLLHVKGLTDDSIDADVGAASDPIDDADFDDPIYVDELWLQQALLDDRVRLRLGLLEQQVVFDRNAYANNEDRQFMASALDNDLLVPLPNGLGAVLVLAPTSWLELAAGVVDADNVPRRFDFDTAFDSWSSLTVHFELLLRTRFGSGGRALPGSYRFGVVLDGREKLGERGDVGAYVSMDQALYREVAGGEEGLGVFARAGYANAQKNPWAWFWSCGLQYQGLLPGRGDDVSGLGVYQMIGSDHYRGTPDPGLERETGLELYHRIALLPWLEVTPDVQLIVDPGGSGDVPDAVIAALRLRVSF